MTKKFVLAAMAAALLSTAVLAQSDPPAGSSAPGAKPMDPVAIQSSAAGKWRASKLVGLSVYNSSDERIGDINELITDSSGKIDTVVIGAGGFLGIGEHSVGIPFSQMKFVNEPPKSGAGTTGSGTTTTTKTTTTTGSAAKDYPDHAVVNMTRDQLKAMPAFKYASDSSPSQVPTSPTAR